MIVVLDTTKRGQVDISIIMNTKMIHSEFKAEQEGSLLICLHKMLKKLRRDPSGIKGIAVVVGAGSFTATRIAATVGNSLAFALRVPAVGVAPEWKREEIQKKIMKAKSGCYISARYSGEPNIGRPRQNIKALKHKNKSRS